MSPLNATAEFGVPARTSVRAGCLAVVVFALAACGGGGGGGGATPTVPPPPPAPPPPASGGTLALTPDNAEAVGLGVSMAESSLQFAQTVVDAVTDFMKPGGGSFIDCYNSGGSKSAAHADNDGDFFVSAGDVLTVTYANCLERGVDDLVDGTLTISISEFATSPMRLELAGTVVTGQDFTITSQHDPAVVIAVTADAAFSFVDDISETLELQLGTLQQFAVTITGVEESITDAVLRKTAIPPPAGSSETRWSTEVSVQEVYDSALLGGSFTCVSSQFEFAAFNTLVPSAIDFVCTGLNGSAVRIVGTGRVETDENGDGAFDVLGDLVWSELSEGFLGRALEFDLTEFLGQVPVGIVQLAANDAVFDPAGNRLLVATSATDARFPASLVAISADSGLPASLVTFSQEPRLVRVSEDGTIIYVTFVGSGAVHRYAADDNRLLDSTAIRANPPADDGEEILDLAVSPVDPNRYAVLLRFSPFVRHDIVMVQDTSQLDSSYYDIEPGNNPDAYSHIAFSSDGSAVIADARVRLSHGAGGLTAIFKARLGVSEEFQRVGDTLHAGSVALDETTLIRNGEYPVTASRSAFDPDTNLAYFFNGNALHIALRDRFSLVAEYGVDLNLQGGDAVHKMIAGGNRLYLLRDSVINVVDRDDIEFQATSDCVALTRSTGDAEAYTNYRCPVRAAAYDHVRDRLYLGISDLVGEYGNTVAVVGLASGTVDSYVPVNARPLAMRVAADGSRLVLSFATADRITELDAATLTVDRESPIPLWPPGSVATEARPRVTIDVDLSPSESELAVVSAGIDYHTVELEEYIALRSGTWLPERLVRNNRGGSQGRTLGFDSSGALFDIAYNSNGYAIEQFSTGIDGLGLAASGDIARPSAWLTRNAIDNGNATVINGDVLDLYSLAYTAHFDLAAAPNIAANGNAAEHVVIDAVNDHTYFAYSDDTLGTPHIRVARFSTVTGAFEASEAYEGSIDRFVVDPFLEAGSHRLAIVLTGSQGVLVIDKSTIN